VIVGMLAVGVLASLASARIEPSAPVPPLGEDFEALAALTWRHARKITILIVGGSLLIVGGVLCLIPGPGLPVIVLALIVLATEFYWARRWLNFARERAKRAGESLRRFKDKL
jgi:tellurite resistance protein TerC